MPTMVYQLLLRVPSEAKASERERGTSEATRLKFWRAMLAEHAPTDAAASGEPLEVQFSKSYLDYLLLLPSRARRPDRVPAGLLCQIIDAKARATVKLGAKVQVTRPLPRARPLHQPGPAPQHGGGVSRRPFGLDLFSGGTTGARHELRRRWSRREKIKTKRLARDSL